jgi:hypothetical protein
MKMLTQSFFSLALICGLVICGLVSPNAEAFAIPQPTIQCWSKQVMECTDCRELESSHCNPSFYGTWKFCTEFLEECEPGKNCQQVTATSGSGCPPS